MLGRRGSILVGASDFDTHLGAVPDCFLELRAAAWFGNCAKRAAILSDHPKPATSYHLKTGQRR
jgi:hypothetical protein